MTSLTWGLVVAAVAGAVAVSLWHGAAASVLFARSERERWRGWLPVVRDVEFFRWGGVPTYGVALLFIPIVSVYALVLRGIALRRIGRRFGWGVGMAILGVLVPPLWTTIAAVRAAGVDGVGDDVDATTGGDARRRDQQARVKEPRVKEPRVKATRVRPARAPKPARTPIPSRASRKRSPAAAPAAPQRPAFAPPADISAASSTPAGTPAPGYDLLVYGGPRFPLTGDRFVVGRAPADTSDVQAITLQDASGTLSKVHAEFYRIDQTWFVADVGSRNGVFVVTDSGVQRLEAHANSPAPGEVRVGSLRLMIRPRG